MALDKSGRTRGGRGRRWGTLVCAVAMVLLGAGEMRANGPRWVTGPPYFTGQAGVPVVWYTRAPRYFTDPGDLSASVNHAAADALVAAAAGVWNVPTASIVLAQGGTLGEHVSGANVYLSTNGPVFPADVQSTNYATMQIAVIYDSDGSVTDTLLGGGASDPAECRQNGVTESVDSISTAGFIQHALLVLNGRCTGPAPEQQLQMQYQLERAFGRVLGLGWSQTNDNVFTQTPQPTSNQALHWPIMHPIDLVCGAYTYQCLPQPFTLRDDDVAGISTLYVMFTFIGVNTPVPPVGKQWSFLDASQLSGTITFPSGQGMQGVNLVLQRQETFWNVPETWDDVSTVSGFLYQRNGGNPVTGATPGLGGSMGISDKQYQGPYWEGYFQFGWVPEIDSYQGWLDAYVTTEPINPLYRGAYAVGPYVDGPVAPSGAAETLYKSGIAPNWQGWGVQIFFAPTDAAQMPSAAGGGTGDGTEAAPQPVVSAGSWTGDLSTHGHTAWSSFAVQAGRTATIEVTALDELGFASTAKAMPLIGVWSATDAPGQLPTVAASQSAFNSVALGMTSLRFSSAKAQSLRMAIADARGDGRPDFAYRARVLYADSVQPAVVSQNGGLIAISGMGFRAGNEVTVNGVPAVVASWTPTSIVAVAPAASGFKRPPAGPVDLAVLDLSTGGTATMTAALTYGNVAPDVMTLVSAPTGAVTTGAAATTAFAVRVFLGDGRTPVVGLPVTLSATGGAVLFGGCPGTPCVVLTDATGLASTVVTPTAFGTVTLQAAAVGAVVTTNFNAVSRSVAMVRPVEFVAAGATVAWTPEATLVENGAAAAGVTVNWTASPGMALSAAQSAASAQGFAQVTATTGPLAAGVTARGQGCAWTAPAAVCANFAATGVDPAAFRLAVVSGGGQQIGLAGTFAPVVMLVTDVAGDPIAGAAVAIHQEVNAAEMACPAQGRCPVAPVLRSSDTAGVSDEQGMFTVTPLQVAGVGEVTNLAVATGTQGFLAMAIVQGP